MQCNVLWSRTKIVLVNKLEAVKEKIIASTGFFRVQNIVVFFSFSFLLFFRLIQRAKNSSISQNPHLLVKPKPDFPRKYPRRMRDEFSRRSMLYR